MSKLKHLTEDAIIMALVDQADLDRADQEHLNSCPDCQAELARLDDDLMGLGRAAAEAVVVPPRSFVLPEPVGAPQLEPAPEPVSLAWKKQSRWQRWRSRHGGLGLAGSLAMAAVLLLSVMIGLNSGAPDDARFFDQQEEIAFIVGMDPAPDTAFMLARDPQVPLSPFHQFVLGEEAESDDSDFYEFLVPEESGELSSLDVRRMG